MSKYLRNEQIETVEMANELGMLNIETGLYYVLDSIGLEIWNVLDCPIELKEIVEKMKVVFDVDYNRCYEDVEKLIENMIDKQLVVEV